MNMLRERTGPTWGILLGLLGVSLRAVSLEADPIHPPTPARSQVLIVQDSRATEAFDPQLSVLREMIAAGVRRLTGEPTEAAGWQSLIDPEDVVGIKVYARPGAIAGTRPAVVAALVEGLTAAGFPPDQIVVWDNEGNALRRAGYPRLAERYGIRLGSGTEAGYDAGAPYESSLLGRLLWKDLDFGKNPDNTGRRSYVTRLLTEEITKIINVTPLLNHQEIGAVGNLYSLGLGSVDNAVRFERQADRLATAVPELYAKKEIGDRVVLNVVDALIGQYEGMDRPRLHQATTLNELRFSFDPVALDRLSVETIRRLRASEGLRRREIDLKLLRNASLLELGVSRRDRILVERMDTDGS